MKNKGFTLVELLTTITILGMIALISIPLIRNLQGNFDEKEYDTYIESLVTGAKLYMDSSSEDVFGHKLKACGIVSFDDLIKKNLVKDIKIKDISCDTNNTFVRVFRFRDKYYYSGYIGCGKKAGDTVDATIFKPNKVNPDSMCNLESSLNMEIIPSIGKEEIKSNDKKARKMTVNINTLTGISLDNKPKISYGFSKNKDTNLINGWDSLKFDLSEYTEAKQLTKIENQTGMIISSNKINTPENENGDFYLVLRVDTLEDLEGTSWNLDDNKLLFFGPYRIDNTPPTLSSLSITSSATGYNNKTAKVSVNVSDNLAPSTNMKMCISESENDCEKSQYKTYAKPMEYTVNGTYDGKDRTIYVHMKDEAGNYSKLSGTYKVYESCSETKSDGNWTNKGGCSKKCGGGKQDQESGLIDKYLSNTKCTGKATQKINCNTMTCCSSTEYKYEPYGNYDACTRACATGSKKRTRTVHIVSAYDNTVSCGADFTQTDYASCNTKPCTPTFDFVTNGTYTCNNNAEYLGTDRTCNLTWHSGATFNVTTWITGGHNCQWYYYVKNGNTLQCNWTTSCNNMSINNGQYQYYCKDTTTGENSGKLIINVTYS